MFLIRISNKKGTIYDNWKYFDPCITIYLGKSTWCNGQRAWLRIQNKPILAPITLILSYTLVTGVGYHLPFQHNELFHLPYMAVAEISLGISLRVISEEPFLLLKYIITLSLILCSYYKQSLSCKYSFL